MRTSASPHKPSQAVSQEGREGFREEARATESRGGKSERAIAKGRAF